MRIGIKLNYGSGKVTDLITSIMAVDKLYVSFFDEEIGHMRKVYFDDLQSFTITTGAITAAEKEAAAVFQRIYADDNPNLKKGPNRSQ